MKPDELALLTELARRTKGSGHCHVRLLARELGMNEKRAARVCEKWTAKGWYEGGVSVLAGWLTVAGHAAAQEAGAASAKG